MIELLAKGVSNDAAAIVAAVDCEQAIDIVFRDHAVATPMLPS
jgi:hypothetical protein